VLFQYGIDPLWWPFRNHYKMSLGPPSYHGIRRISYDHLGKCRTPTARVSTCVLSPLFCLRPQFSKCLEQGETNITYTPIHAQLGPDPRKQEQSTACATQRTNPQSFQALYFTSLVVFRFQRRLTSSASNVRRLSLASLSYYEDEGGMSHVYHAI
jgi:hypothetical protein